VTPLTTDTRTIAALVTAVGSDIMPTQGSSAAAGLAKAGALLRQTGLRSGEILLIGDADVTPADLELAADLRREGFIVHVLAVGTEQGAPIGQPGGGFLTDAAGQVVIPRLDPAGLQRLAAAGGGRFARLATDDRDLDTLFPAPAALPIDASLDTSTAEEYEADVWRDRGSWLVLALLPLLVLGFRRGLLCAWLAWLVLPMPRAEAFEWADLWQRRDQRGYEAFATEHPERAAELFDDREWRGAAEYRAGRFAEAAATLEGIDSADGHYNRGNALAKAGQLEPAIAAYERALELDPAHEDAHYNRDLLEDFLEQNPDQRQPSQDSSGGEQDGEQQRDAAGEEGTAGEQARGEPSPGEQGDEADRPSDGQAQAGEGEGSEDSPPEDAEDEGGEQTDRQAAAAERGEDENGDEAVPGPEDVEQWASEQAAEQWLRRVPQDPGGLLRRKFLYQYQRLGVDQDGNPVSPEEPKPW
jgi:Ca-activated chloride channel family protein